MYEMYMKYTWKTESLENKVILQTELPWPLVGRQYREFSFNLTRDWANLGCITAFVRFCLWFAFISSMSLKWWSRVSLSGCDLQLFLLPKISFILVSLSLQLNNLANAPVVKLLSAGLPFVHLILSTFLVLQVLAACVALSFLSNSLVASTWNGYVCFVNLAKG